MINKTYLAIDIGGSSIKWGIFENLIKIDSGSIITNVYKNGTNMIVEDVFPIIESCILKYNLTGICFSSAGVVDVRRGVILACSNTMPNYANTKIKKLVEDKFKITCFVENDSNCNAIFEFEQLKSNYDNVLTLTLGTGIGGSIFINKKLYRGNSYFAGEVGQIKYDNISCDDLFSTRGLVNFVNSHNYTFENGLDIFNEIEKNNNEHIKQLVISHLKKFLNFIYNLKCILDFDCVIIGGGISKSKFWIENLVSLASIQNIKIIASSKGNDANLYGAIQNFETLTK